MPLNVQCKRCANLKNEWCERVIDSPDPDLNRDCQHFRTKTHYDEVHAMTAEELAKWLSSFCTCGEQEDVCPAIYCKGCGGSDCAVAWIDWLRQETYDEN